jgi:hypothetical protein
VYSKDGESITFTRFHIDPARFVEEVLDRSNIQSVIDGSSPPSLRH